MHKKFLRSSRDRVIGGVAGGLAVYFNADPLLIRLILVVLAVISGFVPMVIIYLITLIIVPRDDEPVEKTEKTEAEPEPANPTTNEHRHERRNTVRNIFGIILIAIGLTVLLNTLFPFFHLAGKIIWGGLIVALGLYLIARSRHRI